ncbi:hypothetical protein EV383_2327 [Pseudonocardia sediminis]|uniref:Ricin-type beta-trefoil lectin protein n=1 Tax=Pseudonocardia sediminis TaxID=1397368 RepID=A0A4Q7UX15_PSEST|nr:hypothetical protein [Pseudonocardia sediminis]RZT85461.1 hypothetical protein EV383_2327 [Pseudonocardia sediminis]
MRRTVTLTLAGLTLGLAVAGTAAAAPEGAHGTYTARDGVTADGTRAERSAPLTDPELGTCFDLLTPDGRAATWARTENETDRLATVSERSCDGTGGATTDASPLTSLLAPGQDAPADHAWRSVRFSSMP